MSASAAAATSSTGKNLRASGPSPIDHHRRRLDDRGCAHPRLEPESSADSRVITATRRDGSVTSAARPARAGPRPSPRARRRGSGCGPTARAAPGRAAARPRTRGRGAGSRSPARRRNPSLPVPASQRVEADPERPGGLAGREGVVVHGAQVLHRLCLCDRTLGVQWLSSLLFSDVGQHVRALRRRPIPERGLRDWRVGGSGRGHREPPLFSLEPSRRGARYPARATVVTSSSICRRPLSSLNRPRERLVRHFL